MAKAKSNSQVDVNSLTKEDREKLKAAVKKIDDSLTRVVAERDFIKTTIEDLADKVPLDKKLIRKLAKTFHKASFQMDQEENETFEELYSTLYTTEVV
jgi:hypothetical protein